MEEESTEYSRFTSEEHITLGRVGGTEVGVFRYMGSGDRLALDGIEL
jgi:hypothetical protein